MKNQIEIVKNIADEMYGIGGIPNNEEFYAEFDMRVKAALGIADVVGRSEQLVCECGRAEINKLSGICEICWNEKFPDEAN